MGSRSLTSGESAEFREFLKDHPVDIVHEYYDRLVRLSKETVVGSGYQNVLAARLKSIIEAKRPASIIRLGDGEGNVLSFRAGSYDCLYALNMNQIMMMMFGRRPADIGEQVYIRDGMLESVKTADIIGFPDKKRLARCCSTIYQEDIRPSRVREIVGGINAVCMAAKTYEECGGGPSIFTDFLWHQDLLGSYRDLISGSEFVGVISCHEGIDEVIKEAFDVRSSKLYRIPNQHMNAYGVQERLEDHYPDRFHNILESLYVPYVGAIFIVSAGILGELYCSAIKKRGGIALDVGSVADVWMGRASRAYHGEEFLARWSLVTP